MHHRKLFRKRHPRSQSNQENSSRRGSNRSRSLQNLTESTVVCPRIVQVNVTHLDRG